MSIGNYEKAKEVLRGGLRFYPENSILNRMYMETLSHSGATVEEMIPFMQAFMRHRPEADYKMMK